MTKIKVVAWDVEGTLIASKKKKDKKGKEVLPVETLRARTGALEALTLIRSKKITQVIYCDGDLNGLKKKLNEAGIDWEAYINKFYKMPAKEKRDFSEIIIEYQIEPQQLLVIGNDQDIDTVFAKRQGCQTLHVPEKGFRYPLDVNQIRQMIDSE